MSIYNIGISEKRFFSGFLNLACNNCKIENETQLFISCKTLVIGPILFGINWWSWGKKASTYCRKCHHREDLIINNQINKEILNEFNDAKIPFKYKYGGLILIVLVSFILIDLAIQYGSIGSNKISNFFKTPEEKVSGEWINDYEDFVYIFEDKTFTAIVEDTLITGNYTLNSDNSKALLLDKSSHNEVPVENGGKISLKFIEKFSNYFKYSNTDIADNPYHFKHQKWRIKPEISESKSQVKKRVLDYLVFSKLKFEWGLDKGIGFIEQDNVSPISFASNGIWLSDKTLDEWKPIFGTNENWTLANKILIDNLPKDFMFKEVDNNFENYRDILQVYIKNVENYKL